jgi:hypothetical protein
LFVVDALPVSDLGFKDWVEGHVDVVCDEGSGEMVRLWELLELVTVVMLLGLLAMAMMAVFGDKMMASKRGKEPAM